MSWTIDRATALASGNGTARYQRIASMIEAAIVSGELPPGERLPTVRELARQLGVSPASVAVAYRVLQERALVRAHVGRGTVVLDGAAADSTWGSPRPMHGGSPPPVLPRRADVSPARVGWRRRSLYFSDRLRAVYPDALVCTSSWPDPALLPLAMLKRAFAHVAAGLRPSDLQYSGPEAHAELVQALAPALEHDGIGVEAGQLLVVSSLVQALDLTLQVAPEVLGTTALTVAVEEPGFHAPFSLIELRGHRLIGVQTDAAGALPASLASALEHGANVVLLTPRALNPSGASWTSERRRALADVLAAHPAAVVIEDDHFAALAASSPGSLLADPRLGDRALHVRSLSKALAPDLRITAVVARGRLRTLLRDARLNAGGWSAQLTQRAVAATLNARDLEAVLSTARATYAERRVALVEGLRTHLPAADVLLPHDGLNVWLRLPPGTDALDVVQHAAHLGVLIASGEAFYVRPGFRSAVRLSIGHVSPSEARRAGALTAEAVLTLDDLGLPLVV